MAELSLDNGQSSIHTASAVLPLVLVSLMSTRRSVCVLGRFPPPNDGQTIMTSLLAQLLEDDWAVHRINTSYCSGDGQSVDGFASRLQKISHYCRLAPYLKREFAAAPDAPVLWAGISPMPGGHFRDLLTVLPMLKKHKRIYGVIHWGNFDRLFTSAWTRHTGQKLADRLSGFVFLDGLADRCGAWLPAEKRITIPNTIDLLSRCTETEIETRRTEAARSEGIHLLYLSNMIESKGYMDVLSAVSLLHDQHIHCEVDFIGRWNSGSDEDSFRATIQKLQLNDRVRVHGPIIDRARIKSFYLKATAFVLPTYYPVEAQPVSILEAINAGTPVIATRHAGIPWMLREEKGEALFVSPKSPMAIADAARTLLDREFWLRCSIAARERFREHFSPESVLSKWNNLLRCHASGGQSSA
jgi:glycosyltransferase involved in cell wall biosynthesis